MTWLLYGLALGLAGVVAALAYATDDPFAVVCAYAAALALIYGFRHRLLR